MNLTLTPDLQGRYWIIWKSYPSCRCWCQATSQFPIENLCLLFLFDPYHFVWRFVRFGLSQACTCTTTSSPIAPHPIDGTLGLHIHWNRAVLITSSWCHNHNMSNNQLLNPTDVTTDVPRAANCRNRWDTGLQINCHTQWGNGTMQS